MRQKLKEILSELFAEKENFSLEERMLISSIIVAIGGAIISPVFAIVFSFMHILIYINFLYLAFLVIVYYFIRYKRIIKPFIIPVLLSYFLLVILIWIFGGGMNGQNIGTVFVILILSLIIVPEGKKHYVISGFLGLIVILYLIQLFKPELITNYNSETNRWIDSFTTTFLSALLIYLLIKYILKNYNSERKRAEESEKRARQLNADKDRFISILSHDMISPYSTLFGFSKNLLENVRNYDIETIEKHVRYINESAKASYELMEDLLIWIRAQRGRIPFNPGSVSLSEICTNLSEALNHESSSKKIEISIMPSADISVFADISMLKIILRNLVSNAIKFTPKGGKITIDALQQGSFTKICVSDNGTGMKPENSAKLFDISQVYTTRGTEEEGGTGLGLLICKELVEKHNGKIWVESEYGRGTTFYFTLKNIMRNE